MSIKTMTTAFTAGFLALGLAACGGAEETAPAANSPAEANAPAESAAEAPAAESAAPADAAGAEEAAAPAEAPATGGAWSASAGGNPVDIPGADVLCQEAGGYFSIVIAAPTTAADQAISVQLSTGDNPTVQAVGMVNADGQLLAYAEGVPFGSASVTTDGSTYEVTGEALLTDPDNPTSMETQPFEITATCG